MHLSKALSSNNSVINIELNSDNIFDEGVKHLSNLLSENSCLTSIDLGRNDITDVGVEYLTNALANNLQSLNNYNNNRNISDI
jgi:hypothetical protein